VTGTPLPPGSYTAEIPIRQWADDAEEVRVNGQITRRDGDLNMPDDPEWQGPQIVALRFQGLPLPPGSIITSASIEFTTDHPQSEPTLLRLQAQATDNAPAVEWEPYNISSRPRSAAFVSWSYVPAWATRGEAHRTPNLSAIVQEIVNRPGWQEGNALMFLVTGSGQRVAVAYDRDPARAPVLHIEYTSTIPPSGEPVPLSEIPVDEPHFLPLISR
jgi:hypothetical protein